MSEGKKKSYLLVTNIFPPEIGGPATFIPKLAHHLSLEGYKITVLCYSPKLRIPEDRQLNYKVVRVPRGLPPYFRELYFLTRMFFLFLFHNVAFCNGEVAFGALCSRITRTPCIAKIVGDPLWETERNLNNTALEIDEYDVPRSSLSKMSRFLYRSFIDHVKLIVVPSEYLKGVVSKWGFDSSRIRVVPNGFCVEQIDLKCESYEQRDELRCLFVGRLTNWKGVDLILLALKEFKNARLTILGDGPESTMLKDLCTRCGLDDRVVFKGRCQKKEVEDQMVQSDVLILPSLYEGLSHTLLEAGSMGLPVIASRRGGNIELIDHGKDGLLIDPKSVDALVAALHQMSDLEKRMSMGEALREKITQSYNFETTMKSTLSVLEELS